MGLLDQMGGVLQQYMGGSANQAQATQHFEQVATQAPPSAVAGGLASVFRSPDTGTFGQNIGQLFGASNPQQRAGILNQLLPSLGGMSGLSSIFSGGGAAPTQISPEQAQQVSRQQAEQMANHAQQQNPSVVDQAGQFYSQHPTLIKALGAGAAILALRHIAEATQG